MLHLRLTWGYAASEASAQRAPAGPLIEEGNIVSTEGTPPIRVQGLKTRRPQQCKCPTCAPNLERQFCWPSETVSTTCPGRTAAPKERFARTKRLVPRMLSAAKALLKLERRHFIRSIVIQNHEAGLNLLDPMEVAKNLPTFRLDGTAEKSTLPNCSTAQSRKETRASPALGSIS